MISIRESIMMYLREMFDKQMVIDDDTRLDEDLGMDSLDVIELSGHIENDTGLYLEDVDLDLVWTMETVGDLIKYVENKGKSDDA